MKKGKMVCRNCNPVLKMVMLMKIKHINKFENYLGAKKINGIVYLSAPDFLEGLILFNTPWGTEGPEYFSAI